MDSPPPSPIPDAVNRDGLWAMPAGPPHEETHVLQNPTMRDLATGVADGLVAPFALVAGLSGAVAPQPMVAAAGLVAVVAGSIAMSLGGYLAGRSEADRYAAERRREEEETVDYADRERWEVAAILHRYGVRGDALRLSVDSICADQRRWVDFMMRFELDLKEPEPQRAALSAMTVGAAAVAGGLVPIAPFMLMDGLAAALTVSCAVTGLALTAFGWLKARTNGLPPLRGAIQALTTGGVAAAAAVIVARATGV